VQFGIWGGHVLGATSASINTGEPVLPLILSRFCRQRADRAGRGVLRQPGRGAGRRDRRLETGTACSTSMLVGAATLLLSIPTFWLGLLLLLFFGLKLEWLPVVGYVSIADERLEAGLLYLLMPILTLFLHEIGVLLRMARASHAGGAAAGLHHPCPRQGPVGARRAVAPCLPQRLRPDLDADRPGARQLLGGIAVVETVFTIPGLGRLLVDAIFARDYPVIQGCMLLRRLHLCLST
jgi:peptide/nickel transport system permease protein